MRFKKFMLIAITAMMTFLLAGCGESFPDLTEDEYNQTVEFAVGLLMKYSNNNQEKLTYIDVKELKKQREKEARKAAKEAAKESEQKTQEPAKTVQEPTPVVEEPVQTTEPVEQDIKTDDASSIASTGEEQPQELQPSDQKTEEDKTETPATESDTQQTTNPDVLVLSPDESQEIIDDIFLSYQGYSVSGTYPESSKSYVINADKGKRLLVLRFDLYNSSDSAKKVNIMEKNILFQVILNGKNLGYTAVTVLPNDLSSYVGVIDSRAHESLVILTDIDQGQSTNIQTLGLIVSINGKEQEVALQ